MLRSQRQLGKQDNSVSIFRRLTAGRRALPNLVIAGCQRCGTTSLYRYLVEHPLIVGPVWKEVHYFNRSCNYEKGMSWYRGHFPLKSHIERLSKQHGGRAYVMEATPAYIVRASSVARFGETLPDAKVIVLLRDPIDRAISNYRMAMRKGYEEASFNDAVADELAWYEARADQIARGEMLDRSGYLSRGVYVWQIRRLYEHYPPEQTMVLRSEDLFADVQGVYDKLLSFLELPSHALGKTKAANTQGSADAIDPETLSRMRAFFTPFNQQLNEYLGRDFGWS